MRKLLLLGLVGLGLTVPAVASASGLTLHSDVGWRRYYRLHNVPKVIHPQALAPARVLVYFLHGKPGDSLWLYSRRAGHPHQKWYRDGVIHLKTRKNVGTRGAFITFRRMYPGRFQAYWQLRNRRGVLVATSSNWYSYTHKVSAPSYTPGSPPVYQTPTAPDSALKSGALAPGVIGTHPTIHSVTKAPLHMGDRAAAFDGGMKTKLKTPIRRNAIVKAQNIQEDFTPELACGGEPGTLSLGFPLNQAGVAPNFGLGTTGIWGYAPAWFALNPNGTWTRTAIGSFQWGTFSSTAGNGDSNITSVSIGGGDTQLNSSAVPADYLTSSLATFSSTVTGGYVGYGDDFWVGVDYWYNENGTWYFAGTAWHPAITQFTRTGGFSANYCWLWNTVSGPGN